MQHNRSLTLSSANVSLAAKLSVRLLLCCILADMTNNNDRFSYVKTAYTTHGYTKHENYSSLLAKFTNKVNVDLQLQCNPYNLPKMLCICTSAKISNCQFNLDKILLNSVSYFNCVKVPFYLKLMTVF